MKNLILAINPGSTSTKIAMFENEKELFTKTLRHQTEEINQFETIAAQYPFRKDIIVQEVENAGYNISDINCVVGRGGLVKPIESGVYEVNDDLLHDLYNPVMGEHASNLGGIIAADIVKSASNGAKAYIADPVVVDELQEVARISGHPEFPRTSIFHALNQKAIARTYAKEIGKNYEDINLIVAHLGGGITVGAHCKGRVIDVNNALDGDGPFSPERAGGVPVAKVIDLCFSGKKTKEEIKKMLKGEGGFVAYLGTNDARVVEDKKNDGDAQSTLLWEAMAYQIGKSIGEMSAVLKGDVEAILITGGIAYDKGLIKRIEEMVGFIATVKAYPGEDEMAALATNGLRAINGEVELKTYMR